MKSINLLESCDVIHPDDWVRPLTRSADSSSYSDAWIESNSYGGAPLDHLKWSPVWLSVGSIWWGKNYSELIRDEYPCEYIRGDIPSCHKLQLKWNKWNRRHPLWWIEYLKFKKQTYKELFKIGKYKNRDVEFVLRSDRQYIEWYSKNINDKLAGDLHLMLDGERSKIWYNKDYKTVFKGKTKPVLRYKE